MSARLRWFFVALYAAIALAGLHRAVFGWSPTEAPEYRIGGGVAFVLCCLILADLWRERPQNPQERPGNPD